MKKSVDMMLEEKVQKVFSEMETRVSTADMAKIQEAYNLAREAHEGQMRKSGEPYIVHPIAVAYIVARELKLGANPVIAAFLHDVVEDTDYSLDDIRKRFGEDVAFLVNVVTKKSKGQYEISPQVDNYKQMLESIHYDIRALLVKLADRLHNMRTLGSMPPNKQMKIAGETDIFYAPLANRLGLYNVKIELENLSFRYRCPHDYELIAELIQKDKKTKQERLDAFTAKISEVLEAEGIEVQVKAVFRPPYSIWRKMRKTGDDFNHIPFRHVVEVVFPCEDIQQEKSMALRIYCCLTTAFKEKPCGIINYIDSPKENGYQSFHVQLLSDSGCWEEVHISSERMVRASQLGVVAERSEDNVRRWIDKFRTVLKDMEFHQKEGHFMDYVATTIGYNDDILVFTPQSKPINLPKRATALDFAFEIHSDIGEHAYYAYINGQLASIKTELHRGDVVQIVTRPDIHPQKEWMDYVLTYKAKGFLKRYFDKQEKPAFHFCHDCQPIPGEEVIGFKEPDGTIIVHKRNCPTAIGLASQQGDSIVSVDYKESQDALYPVSIQILAVDRFHLLSDMINSITNEQQLSINSLHTTTTDGIVNCNICFSVHSYDELQAVMSQVSAIDSVEEVKRV